MNQIEKKARFLNFIIKTLKYSTNTIVNNIQRIHINKYPVVFKFRIRDIKTTLFIIIENNSINISTEPKIRQRSNCFITINRARTLHNLFRGKLLITDISLIGKISVNTNNPKYKQLFDIIITSVKKYYLEIIKGTRFNLIEK